MGARRARTALIKAGILAAFGLLAAAPFSAAQVSAVPLGGAGYTPLSPARLLDTRDGQPTVDGLSSGGGALGSSATLNLRVTGRGGVPASGVGAVVLNVTAVDQTDNTFLTVFPKGATRPLASNLNPNPGIIQPNLVVAKVGDGGEVSIYNNTGTVNLIADVQGWFPAPLGAAYNPLVPARVAETRAGYSTVDGQANGIGALGAAHTIDVAVTGRGGVPASGVGAVVVNITAVDQTQQTFLTAFPTGTERPTASNLNPNPNVPAPNLAVVKVGDGGKISIYNNAGSVNVIVDVQGWFPVGPTYTPLNPSRVLETRAGLSTIDGLANGIGALGPDSSTLVKVTGRAGVPVSGVGAVVLNVTATNQTNDTYLTVFPAGSPRPTTSNLNPFPGLTAPNLVIAKVGAGGEIAIYNRVGTVDVIADVHGWFPSDVVAANDTASVIEGAAPTAIDVLANDADSNGGAVTIASVTQPADGSVSLTGGVPGARTGLTYAPDAGTCNTPPGTAPDTFDYTLNGGVTASVAVTVLCVNDAPSFTRGPDQNLDLGAGAQTVTNWATAISAGPVNESAQTVDFVVSNDNNALFTVQPAISPTGVLTYAPAPGINGDATVTIRLHDDGGVANGGVDTSPAQTSAISVNAPPTADPVGASTTEDTPVSILLTGNDPDGDGLTFAIVTPPVDGSLGSVGAPACAGVPAVCTASVQYTPDADISGNDSFTYVVDDGRLDSNTATVAVTVESVNDAPSFVAGDDVVVDNTAGAQSTSGWATAISAGPADESAQTVDFVVSNDANALFSVQPAVSPTGDLTFTPAAAAHGVATVTVQIHDDGGVVAGGVDTSAAQTFTITVNAAPTVAATGATLLEDAGSTSVLLTGTDPDGDGLTFAIDTAPTNGTLGSIVPQGCTGSSPSTCTALVGYTPNADFFGSDAFTYLADDGRLDSPVATAGLTITAVNDVPSFTKGANQSVGEDSGAATVAGWASPASFSKGPANEAAQTLSFIVSNDSPSLFTGGGQPAVSPTTGDLTFTPASDAFGTATVTIAIHDDGGVTNGGVDTSAAQTFTIAIGAVNDAPIVDLNTATGGNDTTMTFLEVVAHDVTGAVTLAPTASVTDVDDTSINSATVTLVNHPDGVTESLTIDLTGTAISLGGGSDQFTLLLTGADTKAHYAQVLASVAYNNTKAVPDASSRAVTFVVNDGDTDSNTATATVAVVPINAPPVVDLDSATLGSDSSAAFTEDAAAAFIAANADVSDIDDTHLESATITLTNRPDGASELLAGTGTVAITVAAYNPSTGVLQLTGHDTVANYQAALRTIAYSNSSNNPSTTPRSVTVVVNDGAANSLTHTATVSVAAANDAPTAVVDAATAVEAGGAVNGTAGTDPVGNVLTNDTDPDNADTKTVAGVGFGTLAGPLSTGVGGAGVAGDYGTLTVAANGVFSYVVDNADPAVQALRTSGQTLVDTFSYTMADGAGAKSTTQVAVTIEGRNDNPTAVADPITAVEAGGVNNGTAGTNPSGNVLTNDTDVDGAGNGEIKTVLGVAAGTQAGPITGGLGAPGIAGDHGTLTVAADGTFSYVVDNADPAVQALRTSAQTLTDTFTYTMHDVAGVPSTTQVTVTIQGANDTPVADADADDATEASGVANATPGGNPTGDVLADDTDADSAGNGETKSVQGVAGGVQAGPLATNVGAAVSNLAPNDYGTVTINANGTWTYAVNQTNALVQALKTSAQTVTDTFSYTVRDTTGATSTTQLIITVHGANDAPPTPIDTNGATNTIAEDVVNGAATGVTVHSADPDDPTLTYSLTDDAGGRFTIDSTTGALTVADAALINFESNTSHSVTAQATDGDLTSSQTFTIAVTNIAPSKPADDNAAENTVAEGASNGTAVGITASSTDIHGGTVTLSLSDDAGGRFAINPGTGVVTVANASLISYESATNHAYTITLSASDGNLSSTRVVTIAVTDVAPTTPTDSNASANSVAQSAVNGTLVGITATSTDTNGGTLTYSLAHSAGGRFAINSSTGVVTVANSSLIDYDAPGHAYSITVRASDGSLARTQAFTVDVTLQPLGPGDAAIIGYNTHQSDGTGNPPTVDSLSLVVLEPLNSGTQIFVTDRSWNGTTFVTAAGDGSATYTAPGAVAAGTVISLPIGTMSLDLNGDTIYVYQGAVDAPTAFVHALEIADGNTTFAGSLSATGLAAGSTAVAVGWDTASYEGPTTADTSFAANGTSVLASINDTTNWYGDDREAQNAMDHPDHNGPYGTAPDISLWAPASGGGQALVSVNGDATVNGGASGFNLDQLFTNLLVGGVTSLWAPQDLVVDTVHGKFFLADSDLNGGHNRLYQGNISELITNPSAFPTLITLYEDPVPGIPAQIRNIVLDPNNSIVYFTHDMHVEKVSYNTAAQTPTVLANLGTGSGNPNGTTNMFADDLVINFASGTIFYSNHRVLAAADGDVVSRNYIYKMTGLTPSSGAGAFTFGNGLLTNLPFSPDDDDVLDGATQIPGEALPQERGTLEGMALSGDGNTLYFATASILWDHDGDGGFAGDGNPGTTDPLLQRGGIYSYALTGNSNGLYTNIYQPTDDGDTNSQVIQPAFGPQGLLDELELDPATNQLYVVDTTGDQLGAFNPPGDEGIWRVSTTGANPSFFAGISNINGLGATNLFLNRAPTLSVTTATPTYTEQGSSVQLISSASTSDTEGASLTDQMAGAIVRITDGFTAGDTLTLTPSGGVTGSFNSTTGVLTLSGASTFANYQTVLASVRFSASGDNPTNDGTSLTRTLTWAVTDGLNFSDAQTTTVTVVAVNDAPAGGDKTVVSMEDTTVTLYTDDFGFSDATDGGAHALTAVRISSLPAVGSLRYNGVAITAGQVSSGFEVSAADIASGLLTFVPALDANGATYATFTFKVRDDGGVANSGVDLDASANTITFNVAAVTD